MIKKILVTGGSGVVGAGLKDIAIEYPDYSFCFPSSKECDLLQNKSLNAFIKKTQPYGIIHLAAISGGIQLTKKHPASVMRDNILLNMNIIEAARKYNIKKIVMTLSGGMYPMNAAMPISEDSIHSGYPHESNYGYAFAKRLVDPLIKAYRREFTLDAVGFVPDAILGPKSNFNPSSSTAIPALIRRFFEGRNGDGPLSVWGDGSPIRQVTSDLDIARATVWCLKNYSDDQVLNIGTSEEVSIKDAAMIIAKILNIKINRIVFDSSKPNGQYKKTLDNSRFAKLSQFTYMTISETIERTVKYFVENYPDREKLRL